MLKTKKNRKNIFNIIKLILFVGVGFVLYYQIRDFSEDSWDDFTLISPLSFIVAVLLVVPNIWLSFAKWKLTLSTIQIDSTPPTRVQSFFAGIITGMLTPNMIGNFLGRFYYFDRKHRSLIVLFTLYSNYAQFIASLTFGCIAVLFIGQLQLFETYDSFIYLLISGVIVAYLIYFLLDKIIYKLSRKKYIKSFKNRLAEEPGYKVKLLLLSFSRFFIFTIQFNLLLNAFGESFNLDTILAIWQVYLFTMIAPSLFLGKIGIKESISLFVLTGIGMNEYAILSASLIIWFVNSLSPALLGLLICRNRKLND